MLNTLESLFKLARKDFRNISDIKLNYSKLELLPARILE